jgi:hypothetical protein
MTDTLYVDEFAGIKRDFIHVDDNTFVVQSTQDVQSVLDANKEDQTFNPTGYSSSRDLKHIARIPAIVYELWLNKYGVDALNPDHKDAVRKLLNDRDWLFLRTGGGQI